MGVLGKMSESVIVDSGCDWVTLTDKVQGVIGALGPLFEDVHTRKEPWAVLGYKGFVCPEKNCKYGERRARGEPGHETIFVWSGGESRVIWDYIDATASGVKVTRLDLQVTIALASDDDIAELTYERLKIRRAVGRDISRKTSLSLIKSDSGSTLYVGSRKSKRRFLRLYKKGDRTWRYEVQFGSKIAQDVFDNMSGRNWDEREDGCLSIVSSAIQELAGIDDLSHLTHYIDIGPARPLGTTFDRTLSWIRACVKPAVKKLIDAGYEAQVMDALGLDFDEKTKWDEMT